MPKPPVALTAVVPVLNEARRLPSFLRDLVARPGIDEVVVVDGGSTDGSVALARKAGVRVLPSAQGRGAQLHVGACAALGETLLFVHADALLPQGVAALIAETLADPSVIAGAFRTRTRLEREQDPWFRRVLPMADLHSFYSRHPYGDQALFCRREAYHAAGGFPDQPIMEDVELARRLRRLGRLVVRSERVEVSARRWNAHPWRTALVMNTFPTLYRLGVSPQRLARWYGSPR
jgi:rSAM/selenodomain-associated transferase 2